MSDYHDPFYRYSDQQLLEMQARALHLAHTAPHDEVGTPSHSYAKWSREWMEIRRELRRRGKLG